MPRPQSKKGKSLYDIDFSKEILAIDPKVAYAIGLVLKVIVVVISIGKNDYEKPSNIEKPLTKTTISPMKALRKL